jgi:spermidine synthase
MVTSVTQSPSRAAVVCQPATRGLVALFAASGASGLMLEIVWSRMLGWVLGGTTWSVMTILVAFMGGLGLGAIFWGYRAGHHARPLRLFGLLEVSIGLYTLAVPFLFGELAGFFELASRVVGERPAGVVALRVVTAALALAPPTLLMGGTLPILTRFAAAGTREPGRTAGLLYAVNTAGAVAGCFATGCLLISWLGVVETNLLAAIVDIGVGVTALLWDRRSAPIVTGGPVETTPTSLPVFGVAALSIAGVSGFCGLAYEVLWARGLLAAITDDTTYAFTLMLTAFLAGHALGAGIAGRRDRGARPEHTARSLGIAQLLAAAAALLSLPILALVYEPINRVPFVEAMSFWGARIPFHQLISLAVLAPAAAFLGASFTLAARLYVGQGRPVGASTGRLYGFNTLCAIAGAVVATAWLIPALGAQRALMLLAVSQAGLGVLAILGLGGRRKGWPRRALVTALGAVTVAAACELNLLLPISGIYAKHEPGNLLYLLEGSGAAITVHQRHPGDRVISINGVNVAGTNPVLKATQRLQAHLPACLHRSPRSVLQIGFGSGGTCYSVSLHRDVQSIEVVELNPDVLLVAREWFGDVNHGVLDDPRVRVRIADAKSHVAVTAQTYDLILSDSTHPRFRGNAALYARDYFANCSRRLGPGGIVSTWLPLYGLSVDDIRDILKSVQSVFPHVQVWYANCAPHENTIVIASRQPLAVVPAVLAQRLAEPAVAADLADVGITSATELLDFFMLGDQAVSQFTRHGRLNTDDHPRLEFRAPQTLRRKQSWVDNFAALRLAREPIDPYLVAASSGERASLARWHAGTTWKLAGQSFELEGRFGPATDCYAKGVTANPEDVAAYVRLRQLRKALAALGAGDQVPPQWYEH